MVQWKYAFTGVSVVECRVDDRAKEQLENDNADHKQRHQNVHHKWDYSPTGNICVILTMQIV
jgi:hypothetical protein